MSKTIPVRAHLRKGRPVRRHVRVLNVGVGYGGEYLKRLQNKDAEDKFYDYMSKRDEIEMEEVQKALSYKKGDKQFWDKLPAARLSKIWNEYAKTGIIRDEAAIEDFVDIIERNVAKLSINTAFMGHATYDGVRESAEKYELTTRQVKKLRKVFEETNYAEDDRGQHILSDYGLKPLESIVDKLHYAKTYPEKLLLIDRALNVVHQRGDLAALFIEGGSNTLTKLAIGNGYNGNEI